MRSHRSNLIFGGVLVVLVSLIVGLLSFIVTSRLHQVSDNTEVLRIVVAVTGCTTKDTPESCKQRLAGRIAEVDCITRRALAGLPAPAPPATCIAQTPPDIYPGGTP